MGFNPESINLVKVALAEHWQAMTGTSPEFGAPYEHFSDLIVQDYTGIVGLSGNAGGCVLVTCDRPFLENMVRGVLQEGEGAVGEDDVLDMVGEFANMVAGVACSAFDSIVHLSVPVVIGGQPDIVRPPLPIPAVLLPITWQGESAIVAVGIENRTPASG